MTMTGLDAFDSMVQEANLWLKGVMQHMGTDDRHTAYVAVRAALHALRDRIGPENAVHLGAQLPTLLRGVYYEGWHMAGTPTRERHLPAYLEHVRGEMGRNPSLDAEVAARAVFVVMADRLDRGEVEKVIALLPQEIRALWPELPC